MSTLLPEATSNGSAGEAVKVNSEGLAPVRIKSETVNAPGPA